MIFRSGLLHTVYYSTQLNDKSDIYQSTQFNDVTANFGSFNKIAINLSRIIDIVSELC